MTCNSAAYPRKDVMVAPCPIPRVCLALGGSSAINSQIFASPDWGDVENWGPNFSPGVMEKYFESFNTSNADVSKAVGKQSPLKFTNANTAEDAIFQLWKATWDQAGLKWNDDIKSYGAIGAFSAPMTVDPATGERSYSANAYLAPHLSNPKLTLITEARVTKILLSGSAPNVTAAGVSYVQDGQAHTALASQEVVLCAGALNSPKILELSGIGDPEILGRHGIEVRLPSKTVGATLQDHSARGFSLPVKDEYESVGGLLRKDPDVLASIQRDAESKRPGLIARSMVPTLAFLPLVSESEGLDSDLSALLDKYGVDKNIRDELANPHRAIGMVFLYKCQANWGANASVKEFLTAPQPGKYHSFAVHLMHPFSRRSVHITSADPTAKPEIDLGILKHELENEILARLVLRLQGMTRLEPLRQIFDDDRRNGGIYGEMGKGKGLQTLDDAKEYVRRTAHMTWHAVSSVAMGAGKAGEDGVVDENLVIRGTKNLRVVDASVLPRVPRTNTQASVYAIAERAADLILKDLET